MEVAVTAKELSRRPDVFLSYAEILAACRRSNHAIPHMETGSKSRKKYWIRPSVFEHWIAEEELLTVGE